MTHICIRSLGSKTPNYVKLHLGYPVLAPSLPLLFLFFLPLISNTHTHRHTYTFLLILFLFLSMPYSISSNEGRDFFFIILFYSQFLCIVNDQFPKWINEWIKSPHPHGGTKILILNGIANKTSLRWYLSRDLKSWEQAMHIIGERESRPGKAN